MWSHSLASTVTVRVCVCVVQLGLALSEPCQQSCPPCVFMISLTRSLVTLQWWGWALLGRPRISWRTLTWRGRMSGQLQLVSKWFGVWWWGWGREGSFFYHDIIILLWKLELKHSGKLKSRRYCWMTSPILKVCITRLAAKGSGAHPPPRELLWVTYGGFTDLW